MESTNSLQKDITKIHGDMNSMRMQAAKDSVHMTTGRSILQRVNGSKGLIIPCLYVVLFKDVVEHIKDLDLVALETQPVRLKYAKLKKKLEQVAVHWQEIKAETNQGMDAVEIALENEVTL